jgi:hypothetical protein
MTNPCLPSSKAPGVPTGTLYFMRILFSTDGLFLTEHWGGCIFSNNSNSFLPNTCSQATNNGEGIAMLHRPFSGEHVIIFSEE